MASVDSITFDKAGYAPGDTVTLTCSYTPDTPSVATQTFTATVVLSDANGTPVASNAAPFTVSTPQPGDKPAASDDGGHNWQPVSDTGAVAVFTAAV